MLVINDVSLSKSQVKPGEKLLISVEIGTWDNVKAKYTWDSLKNSGLTWNTLKARGEK